MARSSSRATRFCGRGREGDELNGSKAGSRDAGRFTPATGATELLLGEDSMVQDTRLEDDDQQTFGQILSKEGDLRLETRLSSSRGQNKDTTLITRGPKKNKPEGETGQEAG